MNDHYARELKNIRITLIFLTIIVAFVPGGSGNVTIDPMNDGGYNVYPQASYSNMIDMGNRLFGVLTGSTDLSGDETFKIYYYDREKDELIFKKETMPSDLE